jgi:hypothetical protein
MDLRVPAQSAWMHAKSWRYDVTKIESSGLAVGHRNGPTRMVVCADRVTSPTGAYR